MSDEIYQKTFEDHYYESEGLNVEARKELSKFKRKVKKLQAENTELRRKLGLAVKALKFYGNSSNYESHDISRTDGLPCYDILCFDFTRNVRGKHLAGKRARQALKEIGEER